MLSYTVLVTILLESLLNILVIFKLLTNFAKIKLYLHLSLRYHKKQYNSKEVTWTFFKDTKIMAVFL